MKLIVWMLVVVLILVHQATGLWEGDRLLLGFLPLTMACHIGLSIAASAVWYLATVFAWPEDLDSVAEKGADE